ncbi:MAG: YihY/virulence factor BrkB family protein [Anaerolineae bacterium]|nr:YihY/virulence factor BrkB family protein [Anaerolineae bacterium]
MVRKDKGRLVINETAKKSLKVKAQARYRRVNRLSQGILGIVVDAFQGFLHARALEGAAAIAYYALFSLFPLLFFLVAVGSSVLKDEQVQRQVLASVTEALPTARDLVEKNIEHMLEIRGTVGLLGTIGLAWSATAVFNALTHNINRAWRNAGTHHFLRVRLMALVIAGSLIGLLLILSLFLVTLFNILSQLSVPLLGDVAIYTSLLWGILTWLIPWVLMYFVFLLLYWWIPNTKVKWSEANWGALIAASAWEVNRAGFVWYLNSGLARYQLVYGSIGALVALMLWIYLSSVIAIFGAHLSASIASYTRPKNEKKGLASYQTYLKP